MASFPLPKDHWLYAPREYDVGAEHPKELPSPILTHALRAEVVSAIRYAIRGATMCGKETDFDPDALVQNAVYALCGPYRSAALAAQEEKVMNTLKIGQHCPVHKGIYAGLARSYVNEPDNHIWLLDIESPEAYMNWADATAWAESLGEATGLPTKYEAALVGCNLTEELGDYGYVWTSTSDGALRAWFQYWYSSCPGGQYSVGKTGACRVRAVKRLPVTHAAQETHPT